MAPQVLTDPIGVVVDLACGADPALERVVVEAVVAGIAGGRAKRRRLAQALLDRPTLLADGRSPAPRVVADLLIALRQAGAARISPPVCATCGKPLRTLQRRGQDWYCAACGPRPRRCAACGQDRIIASIDRQGRPRCGGAPTRMAPIRWWSSRRWSPGWTRRFRPAPCTQPPAGCLPGLPSCGSWPGSSRTGRSCSPAPVLRRRSPRCCG